MKHGGGFVIGKAFTQPWAAPNKPEGSIRMLGFEITLVALGVFAGMLLFMEIGRRIGRFRNSKQQQEPGESFLALEGSVFGLMGLLIAFTFSAAASRFEIRRNLVVEETNDIGTAWKRLDLLPPVSRSLLREKFREYVDSRLTVYRDVTNSEQGTQALARSTTLQDEIWERAVTACAEIPSPATTTLILSSLNVMFDITTTRTVAARTHLPWLIRGLLMVLPLICALLAGLDAAAIPRRSWVRTIGFALMVSVTVFVILDLDYPRVGLIRIDMFDQALIELRNSM